MEQSRYLIEALQGMAAQPQAPISSTPDLAAMADAAKQRKAWEAANPGQSYLKHNLGAIRDNIAGAPQAIMQAPAKAASGLLGLVR